MPALNIAPIRESDIAKILEIEQESFLQPWNRNLFLDELLCRNSLSYLARCNDDELQENPVGYICFRLIADEMHIFKIAVAKKWRRLGVASWLLEKCFDTAYENNAIAAFLEVRYSNNPAIIFYNKLGFIIIGYRSHYYSEPFYTLTGEDALVMMKKL